MRTHASFRRRRLFTHLSAVAMSLLAPVAARPQAALPIGLPAINGRVVQIRFFESGAGILPPGARLYATRFEASATRYVNTELELSFPQLAQPADVAVACTYFKPDGSVFGSADIRYSLPRDWTGAVSVGGWGNAQGGSYTPGMYRVKCASGDVALAEGAFEVVKSAPVTEPEVRIQSLRFFEATKDGLPIERRQYASRFESVSARHLFAELLFTSPKPGRVVEFTVDCVLRSPSAVQTPAHYNLAIQPEWTGITSTVSWGWDEPGKWAKGIWRVSCTHGGKPLIEQLLEIG
jgi:hypothetical protein